MKKYLIILAVVAVAAIGVYYFFFAKNDSCKNVIPEDAKAVLVFDATEAVKQLDFSISDIIDLLKQNSDNNADLGIDFLSPMYGFVSNDNYLCGVFALSDADAFGKAISDGNVTVESQRGFKWAYTNDILVCFDSGKALVMGPISKGESDGMRGKMVEWMNQGSHSVPLLSSIMDKEGIFRLRTSLGAIPDTYKSQFSSIYKNVDFDKVFFNATFNIKDNAFLLTAGVESEDKEYTKLVSEWSVYNRPIQADQVQIPYENPLALMVFNLDGEALYNKLCKNPQTATVFSMMNLYCNTGLMFQAIDGNVVMAFDNISDGQSNKYYVNAHVKNKDFMKGAEEWESNMAPLGLLCHQVEGDNYMISANDVTNYFGVRGESLYFASDLDAAKTAGKLNSSLESQIKDKLFYLSLDIDKLVKSPYAKSQLGIEGFAQLVLNYFDRLNVSVVKRTDFEIELTTKQKISDILKMTLTK